MKERIHYWDNIKGLLIFLVVFAHCLYDHTSSMYTKITVDAIYMFHMAAFVFVSGYFGKSPHAQSTDSILKLVSAYFIFNGLIGIIYNKYEFLSPQYSYWYIIALIAWRLLGARLAHIKNIVLLLFGLALLIGFIQEITNTFALARIIAFSPFYMAGYLLNEETVKQKLLIKTKRHYILGSLSLFAATVLAIISYNVFDYAQKDYLMYAYRDYATGGLGRFALMIIAILVIYTLTAFMPNKKLPLLTRFGCCSLTIFLFHRIFTLWFSKYFILNCEIWYLVAAFLFSVVLCLLFSIKRVSRLTNDFLEIGSKLLHGEKCVGNKTLVVKTLFWVISLLFVFHFPLAYMVESYSSLFLQNQLNHTAKVNQNLENQEQDPIYRVMTKNQIVQFEQAFRILFVGDLILLEDQVKRGYVDGNYDYSNLFEYTKNYISSANLAIGVFEGPAGGRDIGYSTSNYGDHKELALNYPDEFAMAIKDTGFDLVTTANNHLLDKGVTAAHRTLDLLDSIHLDHVGSWRTPEEKLNEHVKLIDIDNMRFAVLAYTYGSNGYTTEELLSEKYEYLTSVLPDVGSPYFEDAKFKVAADFESAKRTNPDFIIVLPHLGTQFINTPDENQKAWYDYFIEMGADVILGDHSHSIQPVALKQKDNKTIFELYCPGNYANVYREHHGDATAMVEVYIDRAEKKVIGGGVVPMYVMSPQNGNFRPIPIYNVVYRPNIQASLSTDDVKRASEAHSLITSVMLHHDMPMSMIQPRYYFDENGFMRLPVSPLKLTDEMNNSPFMKRLQSVKSICFIGDSVTHGTKNGGFPWYEPIASALTDHQLSNAAFGGATSKDMLDIAIPDAELYVIAIGTNDVRYRDPKHCAMDPVEYVATLSQLRDRIIQKHPKASFVFIAPWTSTDGDPYSKLSFARKLEMNQSYSEALLHFTQTNGDLYIDPNPIIMKHIEEKPVGYYLLDHIHPNVSHGIELYSEAVLISSKEVMIPVSSP